MGIRGAGRLRQAVRRFRNRYTSNSLILLYHRVAEVGSDPWSLCVTPQHFAEHLEVLRRHSRTIQLQQLTQDLQGGKFSHQSVVITFDDGYADNLHNAKPLLERYDIPATVFVTTGSVGHQHEFWWDELEQLFLQPGTLPEQLHLSINGSTYQWELGEAASYSKDAYQRHLSWRVDEEQEDPSSRHFLYRSLWQLLRPLLKAERRKVLDELLGWAVTELVSRQTHRCLTIAEVLAIGKGGLIEVGSHTVTHPFLSSLSAADQRDEIQQSKACLEKILEHPVTSFAYPYGDYTAQTAALVREARFACACSTFADIVWQRADCFQLPRVVVEDWDGEEFARRLDAWFYN